MLTPTENKTSHIFLALVVIIIIVGTGFIASTGDLLIISILVGGLGGIVILSSPKLLFMVTIFGSIVIAGLTQLYLPKLELVRWGFAGCAIYLIVYVISYFVQNSLKVKEEPVSPVVIWGILFIAFICLSMGLNNPNFEKLIVGIKGYFQVWGIFLALAFIPWDEKFVSKLPKFLLILAFIQIPFVLHQYFYLVPIRQGITDVEGLIPIDIVSGTFGGKINSGAANAPLSVFCFIVFSCLLALWANKLLSTYKAALLSILVLFPVFINSTKISALYLLVVLFVIFRKEMVQNPLSFMLKLLVVMGLLGVMAFSVIKHTPESLNVRTFKDLIEFTYSYNVENETTRETKLSRGGSLKLWLKPVKSHSIKELLIGYGPGASRTVLDKTDPRVIRAIGQQAIVGNTAVTAILWEAGIVGLILVFGLFTSAFFAAVKLTSKLQYNPYQASIFLGIQAGIVICFISLFHKNSFIYHIGYQAVLMLLFGYIVYWQKQVLLTTKNSEAGTKTDSSGIVPAELTI